MSIPLASAALAVLFVISLNARQPQAKSSDRSPHTVQSITVTRDVKLEVLDWGGSGRPLIFLAGSGFDAHVFDEFAPKFLALHHVYGITRRGTGASSAPPPTSDNYSADRLGDDVLAVIDRLQLDRPVLVGHSLAGEEMSSIGSRYPRRVSGLIYLDAGYSYAYYTPQVGDPIIDALDLNTKLGAFLSRGFQDSKELKDLQQAAGQLDKDLQGLEKQRSLMPPQPPRAADASPPPPIPVALSKGRRKYTDIPVPVLAIYADPHNFGELYKDDPNARAAVVENDRETTSAQADALQAGVPTARIVKIPDADHFIFRSNPTEVLTEMNAFLRGLP